jgi:hypothetical protein
VRQLNKKYMKKNILLLCLFFCSVTVFGQTGFTTKTVSIFKNGNGFFVKEGKIQPKEKKFTIKMEDMPRTAFGTFWISSNHLKHLTSYQKEFVKMKTYDRNYLPVNKNKLITDNVGKAAVFHLSAEQKLEGKIVGLNQNMLMIENNGEWTTIPLSMVQWITLKERPKGTIMRSVTDTLREKRNIVELAFSNNSKQNMDLIYFRNGIGWLPNYKVELLSDKEARITMKAGVTNDAEDLDNVDLNFVVGYPNIKYANTPDLFHSGSIQNILNNQRSANQNFMEFNDMANRSAVGYNTLSSVQVTANKQKVPNLKGESDEDLYFYNLKNVTLPKGGRAYYTIFEAKVGYEHIYEVKLTPNHNNYYKYQQVTFDDPNRNKVWHTINLKNKTKHAWTNGAAMVVKKDGQSVKPISQDDLPYTSIGDENALKLTLAPDVSIRDKEEEENRLIRQQQADKYYYDVVTVKGEVKLHNFKDKKINLKVSKTIVGTLNKSSLEWLSVKRVNLNNLYNKTNDVCWELELDAGEEKTIEYEYKVFVRR